MTISNAYIIELSEIFLGVGKTTPIPAILPDMGWHPVFIHNQCNVIHLWWRLMTCLVTAFAEKCLFGIVNCRDVTETRGTIV